MVRPPDFPGNLITGKMICLSHTTEKEPGEEPKCFKLLFRCYSFTLHPAFPGSVGEKLREECLRAAVTKCHQLDRPAEFTLSQLWRDQSKTQVWAGPYMGIENSHSLTSQEILCRWEMAFPCLGRRLGTSAPLGMSCYTFAWVSVRTPGNMLRFIPASRM